MGQVRASLPWAESRKVKEEIDLQILTLLGPKREEDLVKPPKTKGEKKEKKPATSPSKAPSEQTGEGRLEVGEERGVSLWLAKGLEDSTLGEEEPNVVKDNVIGFFFINYSISFPICNVPSTKQR